jgi:serine/threonine-protein kinase
MHAGAKTQAHLGRYELLARLATGGMGEIFLARLEGAAGFEKLYVVKRILPHLADDARFRQMLIAEAQIAAKMAHSNICQVYELGEMNGQLYIAMEYLEGATMLPLLRRASKSQVPLDFGFVAGVVQQACDALHYAHELKDRSGESLGLIHRDVSPSNVFITESGVVKILDFGIAKAKGASTKTEDGAVKGKYAYMAPEQLRGGAIDRRVDVFALGVVLYEMIALRRLFQRKTDYLTFRAVMEQAIPDIRRYRSNIPEQLALAVERALDRDAAHRFDTARQLAAAVLDAVAAAKIRPWTQGEISDFVRAHFAADLGKRSQQVADAVSRRAGGTTSQRLSIPLIVASDDGIGESDDDGIPPASTDVDVVPRFRPSGEPLAESFTNGGTPPPFAMQGERTESAPSLKPLGDTPPPTTRVTALPRRGLFWPIVAIAMVVISSGALFLVWSEMQNQAQRPAVIHVTQEVAPASQIPFRPALPPPEPPVAGSDVDSGSAETTDDGPPKPGNSDPKPSAHARPSTKKFATYDQALAAQKPAMVQCLMDYREGGVPKDAITAVINIAASGRAKSVQLKPETVNAAPLGGCLRNVLMGAAFPRAPSDSTITVPLKPKAT